MRILLLEGDLETASAREKGLALEGHEVSVASRAREALGVVASQVFDAVVLDIAVPDGSGYDVLAAIHESGRAAQVLSCSRRAAASRSATAAPTTIS